MQLQWHEKFKVLISNRWLVLVCAMWVQSCAGVGYLFGSISPLIKSAMGYDQRQVAFLGVAKDFGDSIGFVAGSLCEVLPIWVILLIGVVQNFVGYGLVWLVVAGLLPALPLWVVPKIHTHTSMLDKHEDAFQSPCWRNGHITPRSELKWNKCIELCLALFVGTNGETYFNTAALVSCVQNFPKSRGPVVGILKGFAGLSGAILTQIYLMINFPNESSLIFMVAVEPTIVITALMFIVRPVGGHKQVKPSDNSSFFFTYSVCLILAIYLLAVLVIEDLVDVSQAIITLFAVILILLILLPVIIPIRLVFFSGPRPPAEESLLSEAQKQEASKSEQNVNEIILSEVEDEKPLEVDSLLASERQKRIAHLQAKLFQAAAEGAVRRRKGPRRGEDFTLMQALRKADFWLIFFSLFLASGSGLTVIDNFGQICESLGYDGTTIYVSYISVWNFLGRVGGGYFSELVIRKYAYPRPVTMAVGQVIMAIGLFYANMGWPGEIYVLTVLIGLGYGAHWAIVPASASELFGLKSFGALYNFLTLANPVGSLIFSVIIASGIYDYFAELQAGLSHQNSEAMLAIRLHDDDVTCLGTICYSITFGILSGLCLVATVLSLIVVYRTKKVYANLYGNSRG